MSSNIYIGPVGMPHVGGRSYHPHFREPEPRTPRFSEDGRRIFDAQLGCWTLPPQHEPEPVSRGKMSAVPEHDGSGSWWEIWCDGYVMWVVEAHNFDRALSEKRRLCQLVGGRSGWAHLRRLTAT